ncbi:MAG TPA: hypothetical protein VD967_00190 [Candidatus Paceibacterota bacterium]|nr:hypothetical protein [Candidatus Paceibacterota bacterium]
MEEDRLDWSAPEYTHHPRSVDWFWGLGLLVIGGSALAIYLGDPLFAIILFLAGILLALFAIRPPQEIGYSITPEGIFAGETLYPFPSLKSFWVTDGVRYEKIILVSKRRFMPYIVIPVVGYPAETVREYLERHLPAEEHEEPWVYVLAERLGF